MTPALVRQSEGARPTAPISARLFGWLAVPLIAVLLAGVAGLPMTWQQQAVFGGLLVAIALLVRHAIRGTVAVYILVLFSCCATTRYAWWRIDALHHYFFNPWSHVDPWNAASMLLLISAELYSFLILYLGFIQTIAPLRRPPVPLPADPSEWPSVDVMVPTYNEPLEVVRYTVLAAQQMDWPEDKLNVWLLDDGNRPGFREFAEAAGAHYIARPEHNHAKAGNINYALARTKGELIAIFDSDHIPTRSFLQVTAGWFLADAKLGMLQTPHHFYSPDPFERNLGHFREVPNEGELFYGIIQDTNDLWNATFFCGSCAVLRRTALNEVGGIAHETVTEDAHTSFRMHRRGWGTAYINLVQAAGLATESIGDHIKQRTRWARGMAQILRIDNPLLVSGLELPQRLCYLNAMIHFFYALPRLIFLIAPIFYLIFGKLNIPGYWLTILVFALPHLALATITNSRIQGEKRHSFWNEIYETVLSPYILLPTLLALVSPKLGKFNVTAKGQNQEEDSFDHKMARPFIFLMGLNLLALAMAVPRYLFWDAGHRGTVLMNGFWTVFNVVVLGVSLSVCWETRQRRTAVRVTTPIPIRIQSTDGTCLGVTHDVSVGGASVRAKGTWSIGERVQVYFPEDDERASIEAHVVQSSGELVSLSFAASSLQDQRLITRVLYSRADRWLDWSSARANDNPVRSFMSVVACSLDGFGKMFRLLSRPGGSAQRKPALARNIVVALIVAALAVFAFWRSHAEVVSSGRPGNGAASTRLEFSVATLGARQGVLLSRANPSQTLLVSLPGTVLAEGGEIRLKYSLPDGSKGSVSTMEVLLNEAQIASITPSAADVVARGSVLTIPLPGELLARENRLTFRLAGAPDGSCGGVVQGSAPLLIEPESRVTFDGQKLAVANDLSLLPEPFIERAANLPASLPFVFARQPDLTTLQSAGVLASWAGIQAYESGATFPVKVGELPTGNAVVFLPNEEEIGGLVLPRSGPATLSIVSNPADPVAKLLVFQADTPELLLSLTRSVALGEIRLSGSSAALTQFRLPEKRSPNDAPRWIHADRTWLKDFAGSSQIQTSGSNPVNFYLRFAPDFDFGSRKDMYLHLEYTTDAGPIARRSNIQLRLNGVPADSVPLVADKETAQKVNVALGDLPAAVFANTLQAQFYFVPPASQRCQDMGGATARIGGGTYLDMGGAAHLTYLPDLRLFANAGYPFTRRADLSETAVLLPEAPSASELSMFLDLAGYFGAQTGYPATRLQLDRISNAAHWRDRDLLVVGKFDDLNAQSRLAAALPLRYDEGSWTLSRRASIALTLDRWWHLGRPSDESYRPDEQPYPDGLVEGMQSPFAWQRSVVFVLGKDERTMPLFISGLLAQLPEDGIRGNVSLFQDGNFLSYELNAPKYALGDASVMEQIRLILPRYPGLVLAGLLLICFVLARWMQAWITVRIAERLAPAARLMESGSKEMQQPAEG